MSLKYDFDLVPVFGEDVFADQDNGAALNSAGIMQNALANYVASFRDPATAEALRGADDVVKTMFKTAGFGFLPSGVTLPDLHYNPDHEGLRNALLNRFAKAQENPELEQASWNGFDFQAFLACALAARPAQKGAAANTRSGAGTPSRAKPSGAIGPAIRFVIFFVVMLVIFWQLSTGKEGGLLDGLREVLSFEPQSL